MEVRYQLGGEFGLRSGTNFLPVAPAGGLLRLAYPTSATGPLSSMGNGSAPQPGPVALLSGRFGAAATVLVSHFPSSMALAAQHFSIHFDLVNALGTLRPTGTLFFSQLHGQGSGMITCFGAPPHCDAATAFVPRPLVVDPFSFSWNAVNHLLGTSLRAAALLPKSIVLDDGPSAFVFRLVSATEIDRHLVPEPGSLPLAAGGLAALALFDARRRRARS